MFIGSQLIFFKCLASVLSLIGDSILNLRKGIRVARSKPKIGMCMDKVCPEEKHALLIKAFHVARAVKGDFEDSSRKRVRVGKYAAWIDVLFKQGAWAEVLGCKPVEARNRRVLGILLCPSL